MRFNIVVEGLLPDTDRDAALAQVQQQLKIPEARARQLLGGGAVTVKRDVDADVADAYCKRLRALGLRASSVALTAAPAAAQPAPAASPPLAATSAATPADPAPVAGSAESARYLPPRLPGENDPRFIRALRLTFARSLGWIGGYALAACAALALTLYFAARFGYLLSAPPILFSALVFLLPFAALLLVSAVMLRPLFPAATATAATVELAPAAAPRLHAFVAQLCGALDIPAPAQLAVDTGTRISPQLLPGWKNVWRGDYRLVIGLPLLDACDQRQLGAALTAELGTRGPGLGLRYAALQRGWRARLQSCIDGSDGLSTALDAARSGFPAAQRLWDVARRLLQRADELPRRALGAIERVDARLQRPLLFESDRRFAAIAGSEALAPWLLLLHRLDSAARDAIAKNFEERSDAGLVDDLPALIRHYREELDEKFDAEIQKRWNNETTARADEAPVTHERIEHLAACGAAIDGDTLALALLDDYPALARAATLQSYRARGRDDALIPTDALTAAATQDILLREQARVYFNGWFKSFRFWSLADYALIRDMPLQDAAQQLGVCVNEIRRLTPDRFKLLAEYERVYAQLQEILLAQHVLGAGKIFVFRHLHHDGSALQPVLEERQQQLDAIAEKLALQETVMGGRITLGLRLCGQSANEVGNLHDALRLLHDSQGRLHKLALDIYQFEQLSERQRLREADYSLPLKRLEEKLADAAKLLLGRLAAIPCPFDARHRSLQGYVEALLQTAAPSTALHRAVKLRDTLYAVNEKLALLAADFGTIAEEAYRIEPIRLVAMRS